MNFRQILRNWLLKLLEEEPEARKGIVKKEPKISVWVSRDKEIDEERRKEEEAKEKELPHPVE